MPIQVPVTQTGLERSIQQAAEKAGKNLRINMGPGARSIESLAKPLGRLTGKADEFTKSMEAANARVLAFGASVGVIAAVSNGLQQLVKTTIEVEKSLANINSILRQTETQLNSFRDTIFDIARNTGQTFDTVAEAALELSRQGLKAEEVTKRLNDALILSRLSGLSAADSVAGLTAAINSFSKEGLTSAQVLNKISAAAASAAVSDRDLIEGLKRSGSVAVASGVQFDELIGIIASLQEKTARGGAVIGNSLKTIFTRIQDLERLGTLQDLGVQVTDLGGQVLSSSKIIENLAPIFAKLDQSSKVNLADNLVGKFQIAPFLALLEQYNAETARSGEVANISLNASQEAYKRNEVLATTLSDAINKATVNLQELANTLGEIGVKDNLKTIIEVFNNVVSGINNILDGEGIGSKFAQGLIKGIGGIIAGPGLALALVAIGKLLLDFAKFGAKALSTFFGLNKAAQQQAVLQGQIAASLLNDKSIRSAILDIEKQNISQAEKKRLQTEFFTKALNEQLAVMQKMQGIARTVAPGVMAGTASKRGGRAAGGFLPIGAESSDISRGVGGAPASAKPVVIPNFAFGGGRRGTMVANDSEYIVPNYANGGDAIFNQDMAASMGLPSNARKVRAASGFIPNFVLPSNMSMSAIKTKMGGVGFQARLNEGKLTKEDRAIIARRDELEAKAKGKRSYMANQQPNKSIMLIPEPMKFGMNKSDHHFLNPHASTKNGLIDFFEGPATGISSGLKKETSKGKQFSKLLTLDEDIQEAIATGVNTVFKDFKDASGNPNIFKTEPNRVTASNVKQIMEKGGPGALGAIKGATFEALMQAIVGGVSQDNGELDVDFSKDEKNILDLIFGIEGKGFKFGDFKNSLNSKDKFARQVLDNVKGKVVVGTKAKTVNSKTAASGYIPNFAGGALEEAVGREQAAGLPISQIRINQSGKLRNAKNPMGLAVTNTRDEPTGAIPNYAVNRDPKTGRFISQAQADALSKETEKLTKTSEGLTMKFFALQTGLQLLNGVVGETTKQQEGFGAVTAGLVEGVIGATQTMLTLQAFGIQSGLKLGDESTAKTRASNIGSGIQRFASGGGGAISRAFTALGPVAKLFGKLGPVLGRVIGFFGRFVPFIGPVIMGFQLLKSVVDKIGLDFKGLGSIISDIGKKIGHIFGFVREDVDMGDSLARARKETAARKAADQIQEATTPKEISEEEQEKSKIAEEVKRIKLETAKSELTNAIKLAQIELTRKGSFEKQLDSAKKLNNATFERMQYLERMAETEKFNAETSGLLLDQILGSLDGIEGITVNAEKSAAAQQKVVEAMKDGKIEQSEILAITNSLIDATDQNKDLNKTVEDKVKQVTSSLIEQRNSLKGINDENLKRIQAEDLILEKRRLLSRQEKMDDKFYREATKARERSQTAAIDEEIAKLQASKAGKSLTAQAGIDIKIAEQRLSRSTIQRETVTNIERELKNIFTKLSSGDPLLGDKEREALIDRRTSLIDQKRVLEQNIDISEKQAQQNLKVAEAGRVLETSLVKLANGFDDFALAQKTEDLEFERATAGTSRARMEADFKLRALQKAKGASTLEERARIIAEEPLTRSYKDRMGLQLTKSDLEINSQFLDRMVDASVQFRDNFSKAFAEGIQSVDDLKSALLNAANQFLQSMTQSYVKKFMDKSANSGSGGGIFAAIGNFLGFSNGGKVNGGSGNRDDVPAMLMGGEYVMNKKAVSRYGVGFMEALNSGSIRGYANGGQVRDREGMFTTPGVNGAGAIIGGANLMSYATQTPIALGRDTITGYGAFLGSESGRMTMFGRRNNPAFQNVQAAKRQAFDLAVKERQAYAQAASQRTSLGSMLASAAISTLVGYGASKATGSQLIGSGLGNLAGTLATGAPSSGGAFGAAAIDEGAFSSLFTRKATGGFIPASAGVDTVPAMLSGGEFVMNAAATKNIGVGNLQALNSGAGAGDNSELVGKLDELIRTTENSQSTGEINITINGSTGSESQTAGRESTEQQRNLSEKIKTAVKQVLADEQRLGGQLRR